MSNPVFCFDVPNEGEESNNVTVLGLGLLPQVVESLLNFRFLKRTLNFVGKKVVALTELQ